ncbi:wax ester synthase/diacylglycerol acyltransferase 4-like [Telopea speciosissima]|uniref:wax ester synthase/diacylglycerol acyltransferase 4-like n=1 Tax=Telopea speciosissima TaxID=54955 RepID=UPI001CC5D446|nr:wax ester synthase/diacylglycerol acyltransferase 4-like [Telopea speciosissima]
MASKQLNQVPKAENLLPPLSPLSQAINSPILSLTITIVFEFEKSFNKSQTIELLRDVLVPTNPRLSCIIFQDTKGVQRWKKVDLKIEDHIIVPTFPSGLSSQDSHKHFYEYLSEISIERLPAERRPPWEVHLIMYPTSNATMSSLVFRLNHALGDGYSLMSAMFSSFKRTDNPSLPITFPSSSLSLSSSSSTRYGIRMKCLSKMSSFISRCLNTVSDSISTLLQGMFLEDDKTAIRSATPRVEFEPKTIASAVIFDLGEIRLVKNIVGCVVAGLMYSTCKHTSIGISNIIGPMQKVALADNPVNGFYFTVGGVPQSLFFTVMSYMGKLRVITLAEKGFIDSELLISCMKEAFGNILEAASNK